MLSDKPLWGGNTDRADLNNQSCLWTVAEMSAGDWQTRVTGVATSALHLAVNGHDAVFSAMCSPEVSVMPLTVTEKGYYHYPSTGMLNANHPAIIS
jgi:fructuronate reductase